MKVKIIIALVALAINGTTIMAQEKIKQTAGRDQLGEFAPKFAELNDDVLFGEVWNCNICFDMCSGNSKMKTKA